MFQVNLGKLEAQHSSLLLRHVGMVRHEADQAGAFAEQHVRSHSKFKRRSGANSLKDDTKRVVTVRTKGVQLRLKWQKKHAGFIEYGTRPHVIRARRARFLAFTIRGRLVLTKKVKHPGTKPYKFGWQATYAAHRVLDGLLLEGMERVAKA
jgi:hypothetical protein